MNEDDIRYEARLAAFELTLSTLLAGVAMQIPGMLTAMHEKLSGLVRDGAANAGATRSDMTDEFRMRLTEETCAALDRLIGTAKAMK
jgi:hypothetical protein